MTDWNVLSQADRAEQGDRDLLAFLHDKYGPPVTKPVREGRSRLAFQLPHRQVELLVDGAGEILAVGSRLLEIVLCGSPGLAVTITAPGTSTVAFGLFTTVLGATATATALAGVSAAKNLADAVDSMLAPPGVCSPGCTQQVVPALPPAPVITVTPTFSVLGVPIVGQVTAAVGLSASILCL